MLAYMQSSKLICICICYRICVVIPVFLDWLFQAQPTPSVQYKELFKDAHSNELFIATPTMEDDDYLGQEQKNLIIRKPVILFLEWKP
jgi:hypothetical protein